ncbi:flagellar biosynthesis protein FlhF [Paenibacillus tarimensis]|uniref:flagellar biosynthesis protein FlhF n=1 Tax=Paenibacillus tarimensis TaxID=416012 RepID=UPI001F02C373|nr:flagellar biosynthesis protein FlhF [Paenibacillus tarimensis]MCF2942323.1 flagellar biosynthesis protein FlhF [Paenibacillus tarimensis]
MRVKRYIVNDVPEALPLIRSELGKDAVILNTKEIFVGGFMGMFRKKKMEVIAAIESGAAAPKQKPKQTAPKSPAMQQAGGSVMPAVADPLSAEAPRPTADVRSGSVSGATSNQGLEAGGNEDLMTLLKQAAAQAVVQEAKPAERPQSKQLAEDQSAVLDELKEMKELVVRLAKQQDSRNEPENLAPLRSRLLDQEVEEVWVDKLVGELLEHPDYSTECSAQSVMDTAGLILAGWMKPFETAGVEFAGRVVHVVGPTGVGKTTTIAKLAAEQSLKLKRKVGLITSDTYRIAAVDQLRTYANILNIPLQIVFSPAELNRAYKELEDRELIFMDTAGRNFRNDLYVSEVNSLMQAGNSNDTYLVLSLTGKTRDMEAVAERFSQYGVGKLIFTKMDETDTYGAVLNMTMKHQLKTAYITYGQNVPDDIEPFQSVTYVKQLLGASAHE